MLELTNHCNLACTTCPREYDYGKEMEPGTMTVENAKAVIDQIWPYLDSIGLTGMGETFLFR
jgi:MoaA/NifB/PqqE/SkfB family radical SAM enzyme